MTDWTANEFNLWVQGLSAERQQQPTSLDLSMQGIEEVPMMGIRRLTALTTLDLSDNDISYVPAALTGLSHLEHLDLAENRISSMPSDIGRLSELTVLEVSHNYISSLPKSLSSLGLLEHLDASENNITQLPESISKLTNLENLNVAGNRLTVLPVSIGNLTNLQELDVAGNRLTVLPVSIGNLTNLQELDVAGNMITALPGSLGRIQALSEISYGGNNVFALPDALLEAGSTDGQLWERNRPGNERLRRVDVMQVHHEFRRVVTNYTELIPLLTGPELYKPPTVNVQKLFFNGKTFSSSAADAFALWYGEAGRARKDDIETLFKTVIDSGITLTGPLSDDPSVTVTFNDLIAASLWFSNRHKRTPAYSKNYVDMFVTGSMEAYNGSGGISCAKGICERFVTDLNSAIVATFDMLVADGPDSAEDLVQIIYLISGQSRDDLLPKRTTPKRKRELVLDKDRISNWGAACMGATPEDADVATQKSLFKACILAAMRDEPAPYNEAESEEVLDAYIAGADGNALFYGGRKRRLKSRKRHVTKRKKPRRRTERKKKTHKRRKTKGKTRRATAHKRLVFYK